MIVNIEELFPSITRTPLGIRLEMNPEYIANTDFHRYRLGFCIADSWGDMWPAPMRNLNDTGKLMLPNYAGPYALPETIGAFALRLLQQENSGGNYIDATLPGVPEGEQITLFICVIDPDDIEFKEKPLHAVYFVDATN